MRRLYALLSFSFLAVASANAQLSSSAPWASSSKEAQTQGVTKPPPPPSNPTPTNAPIDGGLSVLLVAGALYGGRAYRNHKKVSVSPL